MNKQDYPFEHASKSYHIGTEKGASGGGGGRGHSKMADTGRDAGRHGREPDLAFSFIIVLS